VRTDDFMHYLKNILPFLNSLFLFYYFCDLCSVLRVNYDTSARKLDRMDEAMRGMQQRVATEISDAHLLYSHGNMDVIRKITAFNNLSRILEQTADKVKFTLLSGFCLCVSGLR